MPRPDWLRTLLANRIELRPQATPLAVIGGRPSLTYYGGYLTLPHLTVLRIVGRWVSARVKHVGDRAFGASGFG